ncbi:hypothetical protein X759_21350 [Mesorhizobium sp. LSHC420B00]|nr:hypothetical protein X759_21350 [Mesorhizobium sp. LSHC420B00]
MAHATSKRNTASLYRLETCIRPNRGFATARTHGGLTFVVTGWPLPNSRPKKDIEGNYLKVIELAPQFAGRFRGAKREARFAGAAMPNFAASLTAPAADTHAALPPCRVTPCAKSVKITSAAVLRKGATWIIPFRT